MRGRLWLTAILLVGSSLLRADVEELKKEPDLIKRFDRSIELAEAEAKTANTLVKENGSRTELMRALTEIGAATKLALESLRETGKKPAKLTKQYKKGELKTQAVMRQLKDLVLALGFEDRPAAEKIRDEVTVTHEEFLLGVMTGK
ncbi:hypothetical protein [Paludibaculum fermentans]|uniref:Uncharacterized protein n=1 Tax=Paludibaculum fermentans TaxID=1473598 RepID=A0A7S7NPD9_PALFE|nr:hypothetical protein [Paludibaculum fermentans]QOY87346.1 hypothetical protein IRI77_32045 [Paludibaculum fermentans]